MVTRGDVESDAELLASNFISKSSLNHSPPAAITCDCVSLLFAKACVRRSMPSGWPFGLVPPAISPEVITGTGIPSRSVTPNVASSSPLVSNLEKRGWVDTC